VSDDKPFDPQIFGKYYLVDLIATGGMAEVFRAKTFAVGGFESLFVVKRILSHLGEDPEFVAMFVDEAKISVALQHPNIVRVFDFGREDSHFFIAMEHVEGRDLRRVLRAAALAGERVPADVATWVVSEATKGLHFAHTRNDADGTSLGIVHRDISPANLLVSSEGDIKVADFGIAKAENNLIQTDGAVLKGKYAYMSPEQVLADPVDARSDLFSLGIVLYEMLTGTRAFRGEDEEDTLRRVREVDLPAPRSLVPSLSEELEAVVLKALSKDPADRYQTAREMGKALRAVGSWSEDERRDATVAFLVELLGDEIAQDRLRLEEGSKVAAAMHELRSAEPEPAKGEGRLVGVLSVLLAAVVLVAAGFAWLNTHKTEIPTIEVAATGSLEFDLTPAATIFLSGREAGQGETFSVKDLAPGNYELRIEADGYLTVEESVRVTRGGATRVRRELVKGLGDDAPVVSFTSTPAGARVTVDGEEVGTTPVVWKDGWPDRSYKVAFELDGHEPWSTTVDGLALRDEVEVKHRMRRKAAPVAAGMVASPAKTPRPKAPASSDDGGAGSLRVVLTGATWANVYVDGKKLSRRAPFSGVKLGAGSHTIRVENAAAGLDHTQTVNVSAGGSATVRALVR
jgi:hypothetical protein